MSGTGIRLSAGFFVVAISVVLFCTPLGSLVGRFIVGILTLAAIAALAMAAEAAYREQRQSLDDAGNFKYPHSPALQRGLVTTYEPSAPALPPVRSYHLESETPSAPVPRFGRGSKSQRIPWRLPAQPSQVSGIVADEAVLGALTVRAASLVGPGHRSADPATVRQDAYRLGRDATGEYLVVAVADGVSNSSRSDLGAAVAVSSAVTSSLELLRAGYAPDAQWAPAVFGAVAQRIREEAADRSLSDDDVCAVLIVAIIPARPREHDDRRVWVGWLGDVSLWQLDGDRWRTVAGDRKRDYDGMASNALDAVLPRSPGAAKSCPLTLEPGSVLTFVTDGVGDGLAGLREFNELLASRWASPPAIADFINHIGYDAAQFLDDRSAVTVWVGTPEHPRQPQPSFPRHRRPQPLTRSG